MWNLKNNKLMIMTKQEQTHRYKEQTSRYQSGEAMQVRQDRVRGLRDTNYYV